MNSTEIRKYRACREAEIKLDIEKTSLHWEAIKRQERTIVDGEDLFELYTSDKPTLVALHLGQLRAAHRMIQGLMTAPKSEALGAVKTEWPFSHFSVKTRTIWTPEIGDFEACARVWRNKRVTSADTSLTLSYLHSQGTHPDFPDSNREEEIITTQEDNLTFENHRYISWTEPAQSSAVREIVAVVCHQVGAEVVTV